MAGTRRRFGRIRKLPSGRWQARYPGPDGIDRPAPETFARKTDAERWLSLTEAQLVARTWRDPELGSQTFQAYAEKWIGERRLRPRTVELYRWLLRRYLTAGFGDLSLRSIDTQTVRSWRSKLLKEGTSPIMAAKAYRLLRAVMATAADDEIVPRNPCRIRGADREESPERPVLTAAQVNALANLVPDRFHALVLLATFAGLRWGEVTALRRRDLDLSARMVRVARVHVESAAGKLSVGPPKSRAGERTVAFPSALVPALTRHLDSYVGPEPDALVFTGPKGAIMRRGNFRKLVRWAEATAGIGVPDLHVHDLRHTGATLAAQTGASLRDLMRRIGHDSTAAAIRYQHASAEADRRIADALDLGHDDRDDGPAGAHVPAGT